ncbi:hypothetical protein [uncultured Tenacibaculum sp.]|uniref:hypothetical protein n=1 Tax=uncultured Tenacibaculum sp. TaxID=174713 RepID=UPI00262CCF58|nr:hypothetical protein [uncultured Tenacibaculum sp.]
MKYIKFLTIVLFLFASSMLAQIEKLKFPSEELEGEFIKKTKIIDNGTGGLKGYLPPCSGKSCEVPDIAIYYNQNFVFTALQNEKFIKAARLKALNAWYDRQVNEIIKPGIENKLNKQFSNFSEAKKAIFEYSERGNININVPIVKSKFQSAVYASGSKEKQSLKKLKLLRLRQAEINLGNLNNSEFGFLKVNGIPLTEIKDLASIQTNWNIQMPVFSSHNQVLNYNKAIIERISNFGVDLFSEVLKGKNNYYDGFNHWDKLDLMQVLLHYEIFKKYSSPPYLLPAEFEKFRSLDIGTQPFIENFAKKDVAVYTIFHPNYINDQRITFVKNNAGGFGRMGPGAFFDDNIAPQLRAQIREAMEKLLNNVSNIGLATDNLVIELGLNTNQKSWLYKYSNEAKEIINLANENRINTQINNETKAFIMEFLNIIEDIPTAKFSRYKELINLIKENPFVLLEDCIQKNGLDIENYKFLYNHTIPLSCQNRLNSLGQGFNDQPLKTGNAVAANVDYYGVEITKNPDFNLNGVPDTDAEVYKAYKAKFTDLASGSKDDFQFSCNLPLDLDNKADISWTFLPYHQVDGDIWNSTDPLTAIIAIKAWGDVVFGSLVSDDGAIMISAFTNQYWIGSTIATVNTGTQPFSGNRQWGYLTNSNGNLELYARAVDVARVGDLTLYGPGTDECKEDTYYNIGEETWSNLQNEIKDWVNAYNGKATVKEKVAKRFDKTKLKEMLEKNESIDQIKCD